MLLSNRKSLPNRKKKEKERERERQTDRQKTKREDPARMGPKGKVYKVYKQKQTNKKTDKSK